MSVMGGSVEALSIKTGNEPTEKTMPVKARLKGYRQKLMTIKDTRILRAYHQRVSKTPQELHVSAKNEIYKTLPKNEFT